ncbi:MAG: sugar ABC transporter permease, partial [Oscillospiraceae bacterium]
MKKAKRNNSLYAILFIAPFFILFSVFCIWPVIQGVYVSFHKWSIMGKQAFVGFDNYVKFFSDENFWQSLGNTTFFVVITAPILVIVAMALALLANRPTRLKKFFRISYYLPSILSVAVGSFIAKYMFSPYNGFINGVLTSLGFL